MSLVVQLDKVFRINHTDPWVRGDPYRTSRTISLQNMRTSGNQVHGRAPDDSGRSEGGDQAGDGNVIIARTTGGVEYGRPLAVGWTGNAGLNWQRSKCIDDHGRVLTEVRHFLSLFSRLFDRLSALLPLAFIAYLKAR